MMIWDWNNHRSVFQVLLKGILMVGLLSFAMDSVLLPVSAVIKKGKDSVVSWNEKETAKNSPSLDLSCESAVVMEPVTGKVIYEKNKDKQLRPASVTKVMTLLLIMESIKRGKIHYDDEVTVSAHAASMGGSQVFLEVGETQTVDTMIKCIAVSSANDACVAMAEFIAGSEEEFVNRMNQRAKKLGMKHTHFVNCCGLDADGHLTTAYDIAIMSRELTVKYKDIFNYTNIWMDTITHKTAKGSSEFGLSNTNKLIKQYHGATGLKTGSTSLAHFCLSATATRDHKDMIAVVMASKDSKQRVKDASKLLDYGFANCAVYQDKNPLKNSKRITVEKGKQSGVFVKAQNSFSYVAVGKENAGEIHKKIVFVKKLTAPVKKGEKAGRVDYYIGKEKVGSVDIVTIQEVKNWSYGNCFRKMITQYLLEK